jgi:hypothetical protein
MFVLSNLSYEKNNHTWFWDFGHWSDTDFVLDPARNDYNYNGSYYCHKHIGVTAIGTAA